MCPFLKRTLSNDSSSVSSWSNASTDEDTSSSKMSTSKRQRCGLSLTSQPPNKPVAMFLQKLYHMLESNSADKEMSKIVSWDPNDPTRFLIHSISNFEKHILPKYFSSSMSSFKRQLNYYGFMKLHDVDPAVLLSDEKLKAPSLSYKHEHGYMRRGCKALMKNIQRASCTSSKSRSKKKYGKSSKKQLIKSSTAADHALEDDRVSKLESEVLFMKNQIAILTSQLTVLHNSINKNEVNKDIECRSLGTELPLPRSLSTTSVSRVLCRVDSTSSAHWSIVKDILLDEKTTFKQPNSTESLPRDISFGIPLNQKTLDKLMGKTEIINDANELGQV